MIEEDLLDDSEVLFLLGSEPTEQDLEEFTNKLDFKRPTFTNLNQSDISTENEQAL